MQTLRRKLLALAMLAPALPGVAMAAGSPRKVVALGGGVTEIVYALGAGDSLVAADLSSIYPEQAKALPRVGYYRDISVEGIASLGPDLVLASEQSGPPEALTRLRGLGVRVEVVSDQPDLDSLFQRVRAIAAALGRDEAGQALVQQIQSDIARMTPSGAQARPRAISLMSHGGAMLTAGQHTAANAIMALAGIDNVMASQTGYKPVSAEAIAVAAPDLIIVTNMTLDALGGLDRLLQQPSLASTPAARNRRVAVLDDLLYLGFGPRVAQAVSDLRAQSGQAAPAAS